MILLTWVGQKRRTTTSAVALNKGEAATEDWPHKYPGSLMAQGQGDLFHVLGFMFSSFWVFSLILLEYILSVTSKKGCTSKKITGAS